MPDRTELDEKELDDSSSPTEEISVSEDEWSAESALPDGDEALDEQPADDAESAAGEDDAESDGELKDDEDTAESAVLVEQTTDEQPATEAPADTTETAPLEAETTEDEGSKKRAWVPWLVGLPIVAAIALAVGFLIADLGGNDGRTSSANDPTLRGEQADWEIRTYVIGGRYVKGAPENVSPEVERDLTQVVTEIHDALFLRPSRLDSVTKRFFSSAAAKPFEKARIGIPKNADEVQTTHRVARIGVEAASTERAAALVQISAEGKAGSQTFRSSAESKLFLEKTENGWKVIAYEVDQRPGNPFEKSDEKKAGDKKNDGKKKDEGGKKGKGKK